MKSRFRKYPLIVVEWYDHSGDGGWVELKELDDQPIACKTVGLLVKETTTSLHIMSTVSNDGGHGGNNEVLKSCIVSQKTLRKSF